MIYQLLIDTEVTRPFTRVFPMVSSLIAPQYHDDTFWTFSQPALEEDIPNDFDTPRYLEFANDFEVRKRKHDYIIIINANASMLTSTARRTPLRRTRAPTLGET